MNKRIIVFAVSVLTTVMLALPIAASAQSWHLDQTTSFSVAGLGGTLTSSLNVSCVETAGSGTFSTTTEGTVSIRFSKCKEAFGLPCTTAGQVNETIKMTAKFDAVMVSSTAEKKPGVLLTPDTSTDITPGLKEFGNFSCFGITVKVFGKGVIGTMSGCGVANTEAIITFSASSAGGQIDKTYTGNTFDLQTSISSSHPTAGLDGGVVATYPAARTMTCT